MGGLFINDSVYSSVFSFLTGLHFFHLVVGLFLLSLFFWSCSFQSRIVYFFLLRISEVHLFYNLQIFYWHFLEILWLFIFLVHYLWFTLPFHLVIMLCPLFLFLFRDLSFGI